MEGPVRNGSPGAPNARQIRSRAGCVQCRMTRIKCSEDHPTCRRCAERKMECVYPSPQSTIRRQSAPRPVKSCDACRKRKARCIGQFGETCLACEGRRVQCVWSTAEEREQRPSTRSASPPPRPAVTPSHQTFQASAHAAPQITTTTSSEFAYPQQTEPLYTTPNQSAPADLRIIGTDHDIRSLLRVYFSTVHYFGALCFIHEADFWERYDANKISPSLVLIMAANALRFGGVSAGPEDVAKANEWAEEAAKRLIGRVFGQFGATELMEIVLGHYYDFNGGMYTRACVTAGMAARMMTFLRLHMLDELGPSPRKPFLSPETLRRLAWAVWALDSAVDAGNFGFNAIVPGAMTIQLPCDERSFLLNHAVETEPLVPPPGNMYTTSPHVGLAGHFIRAMYVRDVIADAQSRLQRRLINNDNIEAYVNSALDQAAHVLGSLPQELEYNKSLYYLHKDQLASLVGIHIWRNTARRHMAKLRIQAAEHLVDGLADVKRQRKELIQLAVDLSVLMTDVIDHRAVLDPHMSFHAYNAIESLLFEPLRQQMEQTEVSLSRAEVAMYLKPLMTLIRNSASRSELVYLLYPEPVNRMIRLGFTDDLTNEDITAVLKKMHCLVSADAEFDFNESFWRFELSLRQHSADPWAKSPHDRLLEVHTSPSQPNSLIPPSVDGIERTGNPIAEDPVTRLQTFLATNSRRNSPSHDLRDPGDADQQSQAAVQRDLKMMLSFPTGDTMTEWLFANT